MLKNMYNKVNKTMSKKKNKVYFIRSVNKNEEEYGPIKIGMSNNPKKRLNSIQTGNPNKLKIVKMISGGRKKEKELHKQFKKSCLNGEWFNPTKELLNLINGCNKLNPQMKLNSKITTPYTKISTVFTNTKNSKYTVLTHKLFELGMSKNGAWSDRQLKLLGVEMPKKKGWKNKIIGNTYPTNVIEQFIYIKDVHLKYKKIKYIQPAKAPQQKNKAYEEILSYDLSKIKIKQTL